PQGPARFEDLPKTIQEFLPELKDQKDMEGKWPDYGEKVAAELRAKRQNGTKKDRLHFPVDFMPSSIEDLSRPMKQSVRQKLRPKLNRKEKVRLAKTKGWPAYPKAIDELARKHKIRVPWQTLPGSQERWDIYRPRPLVPRKTLPNVPKKTLR